MFLVFFVPLEARALGPGAPGPRGRGAAGVGGKRGSGPGAARPGQALGEAGARRGRESQGPGRAGRPLSPGLVVEQRIAHAASSLFLPCALV